jgi:cytoskeletal protein CcmA (bactofilin family)
MWFPSQLSATPRFVALTASGVEPCKAHQPIDNSLYTSSMANGETTTERRTSAWVGKSLLIQGKIISTENLTIDGRVEGTIELGDHSLTIGAGASVAADLAAQTIIISGEVTGNVNAKVKVDLHATAAVHGNVSTPLLAMADGAVVSGRLDVAGRQRAK